MERTLETLQKSEDLITHYNELIGLISILKNGSQNISQDLRQPSIYQEVDSITTYGYPIAMENKNA